MNSFIEYLRRLTLGGNKESSKRFLAMYTALLLTYAVVAFTRKDNVVAIVAELSLLILSLLGIAAYENVKGVNNQFKEKENEEQARLLGMGGEREARLATERNHYKQALEEIATTIQEYKDSIVQEPSEDFIWAIKAWADKKLKEI